MIICVVGLGYVGLPLAIALSKHFSVIGFDIDSSRINELSKGNDRNNEEKAKEFKGTFTCDPSSLKKAEFLIVTVPTPIDKAKQPDLTLVEKATQMVGKHLKKGAIVVYESTVYPGVTEDICRPILEKESGMKCGRDFKVGYSPERINPGDKKHTITNTIKIVSGMDKETLSTVAMVYGRITSVYKASSIKVAEAAKIIENIQRDVNIALMNELSIIFSKNGIDTLDVVEAAGTKWNFQKYKPGLVGGHCISVDPYYLSDQAIKSGYYPKIILAARDLNEYMARYVAEKIIMQINNLGKVIKDSTVLIMGLSFKEDVRDTRNSKAKDLIAHLKEYGITVLGYDPVLGKELLESEFGIPYVEIKKQKDLDCILVFSPHAEFSSLSIADLRKVSNSKPILFDLKGFYSKSESIKKGFIYMRL